MQPLEICFPIPPVNTQTPPQLRINTRHGAGGTVRVREERSRGRGTVRQKKENGEAGNWGIRSEKILGF